jgi:hypothetical protein
MPEAEGPWTSKFTSTMLDGDLLGQVTLLSLVETGRARRTATVYGRMVMDSHGEITMHCRAWCVGRITAFGIRDALINSSNTLPLRLHLPSRRPLAKEVAWINICLDLFHESSLFEAGPVVLLAVCVIHE